MRTKNEVYVIAEIGINHNGSLDNCYKLIDAAAGANCDCVKFQYFSADKLYPKSAGKLNWNKGKRRYSYDINAAVKSFELPKRWIKNIIYHCNQRKIDFLSSVFDIEAVNYLVRQGMRAIKLPSYVITNIPLVEHCARFKIPLILSTGGAILGEIEEAVNSVNRYHNRLSLLHCTIKYPTELKECNLGVIETLMHAFSGINIGWSDHTAEVSDAAVQAIYLGAEIIEKHITLDKRMEGPDHFFSLEPAELKKMVKDIREARVKFEKGDFKINKVLYGNSSKVIQPHERYLRNFAFVTLFAKRNIKRDERIYVADISLLRPGMKIQGLEPKYIKLFTDYKITAKKDIAPEDPITWECIL